MVSRNPFLNRQQQAPKNSHGKKSEERIAKSLGARLTPASGATAGAKGDMRDYRNKVLMEAKSTVNYSMALEWAWLTKINGEATDKGCIPALSISFVTPDGKARPQGDWILLRRVDYEELLEQCHGDKLVK